MADEAEHPELFMNYLQYCQYRSQFRELRHIDLSEAKFFYPSTLLPLLTFIIKKKTAVIKPQDSDVWGYMRTVTETDLENSFGKSYIPLVRLPKNQRKCEDVLKCIYQLSSTTLLFSSNETAFKYVIGELVDNIYEHSKFRYAWVMAQKYPSKGFIELGFFDDGITIPGNFDKHGFLYKTRNHYQAIMDAINGLSTKDDKQRGYGLKSSTKLFLALGGQILVVSGSGAVYLGDQKPIPYYLKTSKHKLKGTLISMRVQDKPRKINLYEFLE